jgi:hypothetical protein
MNRFRPNIVVSGRPEPHTEDRVLRASIGVVEIGYSARAIRCAVPMVDQATGAKSGPEPTRTLASYRRQPDYGGGVSFGMKAAVLTPGTISVGDEVLVHEWLPEGPDPAPDGRASTYAVTVGRTSLTHQRSCSGVLGEISGGPALSVIVRPAGW